MAVKPQNKRSARIAICCLKLLLGAARSHDKKANPSLAMEATIKMPPKNGGKLDREA